MMLATTRAFAMSPLRREFCLCWYRLIGVEGRKNGSGTLCSSALLQCALEGRSQQAGSPDFGILGLVYVEALLCIY
jgi:hypothetical protein